MTGFENNAVAVFWETNSLRRIRQIADSRVQFITPAGPRHSFLLAKDPNQLLWKPYIP